MMGFSILSILNVLSPTKADLACLDNIQT